MLQLKVGMPLLLIRNLDPTAGLANGTRLTLRAAHSRVLEAEIACGPSAGTIVLIPRIDLVAEPDAKLSFQFTRRQFPVIPAFAMTINTAQGQTLREVGIYLPHAVFAHGQLYVALSRVGDPARIHIALPGARDARTANIVYTEIFRSIER